MPRNPIRWSNVNSNVRSDITGAINQFTKATAGVSSTLKDIYDREIESNTIDAMEQIRAGKHVNVNGQVDRKSLLQFSINNDARIAKAKMDALKAERERQIIDQAELTNPLDVRIKKNKLYTGIQKYNQLEKTNPLDVEIKQNEANYSSDKSIIKSNERKLSDKILPIKSKQADNLAEELQLKNELKDVIERTNRAKIAYENGEVTGEEALKLREELGAKSEDINSRLNALSRSGSYLKYGFTSKDVITNSNGTVKPKDSQPFTDGMLQYNKDMNINNKNSKGDRKAKADSIAGLAKLLYTHGVETNVPTSYKERQKWLVDNKVILPKNKFLKNKIDKMRKGKVVTTNKFQTQWSMKNEIEALYRDEADKDYEAYVKNAIKNTKDLPQFKQENRKPNIAQIMKLLGANTPDDKGIVANAIYDYKNMKTSEKVANLKKQEKGIRDREKNIKKINDAMNKMDLDKKDRRKLEDIIKGIK